MKEKKKVSAREVVADIRSGMTDEQLMTKHLLTPRGLESLKSKLLAARYVSQEELDRKTPPASVPPSPFGDQKAFAGPVAADIRAGAMVNGATPAQTRAAGRETVLLPDRVSPARPDSDDANFREDLRPQPGPNRDTETAGSGSPRSEVPGPEALDVSPAAADRPSASASGGTDRTAKLEWAAQLLHKDYEVYPMGYLKQGWGIFLQYLGGFIGITALSIVLMLVCHVIPIVGPLIGSVAGVILGAGYFIVALKIKRGGTPEIRDFFLGAGYLLQLLLGGWVSGGLVTIGLILLLVPGIYLAVAYLFTVPLIVDKGMFFWDAMETSRKIVTRKWFAMFGFCLLLAAVQIVGALCLGVGLLATLPIASCAVAAAYDDISGQLDTGYQAE